MHQYSNCVDECPTGLNDNITCVPTKLSPICPTNGTTYATFASVGECTPNITNFADSLSKT